MLSTMYIHGSGFFWFFNSIFLSRFSVPLLLTPLSNEYRKVTNSIFWNTSPVEVKRRIRSRCNQLAFDTYSHMIDLAHLLNQYAADKNSEGMIAPKSWQELILNLRCAFNWIESEHPTEINSKQLSLPM
jgi:hypothetical protein